MSLSPAEEALVRDLIAQNAALLSLASSESTIISKLGATKTTLSALTAASSLADSDLMLVRQGVTDKSVTGALLRAYSATPIEGTIQGAFKSLKLSATGTSAPVTVTADAIVVSTGSAYKTLTSVSLSPSLAASGANGLDTGTSATNTWYSVWVIWNGTTTAGLLSLSETAPTMPATYTHKARVGWIRTDGTGNKYPLSFKQNGRMVEYDPVAASNLTAYPSIASGSNSLVSTSASLTGTVPVTGGVCRAVVGSTSGQIGNIFASVRSSTAQDTSLAFHGSTVASVSSSSEFSATLVNRELFYASSNSAGYLRVCGWEDNL